MIRFDILPRLLPDRYYDTLQEALEEVSHRKMSQVADDAVTRFDKLPYGSYRVYTVSFRAAMDGIADGADLGLLLGPPPLRYDKERYHEYATEKLRRDDVYRQSRFRHTKNVTWAVIGFSGGIIGRRLGPRTASRPTRLP